MKVLEITMFAVWFIPIIICIAYVIWSNRQDKKTIKTVNDAFDKAQATFNSGHIPGKEIDYEDSERPFIDWHSTGN